MSAVCRAVAALDPSGSADPLRALLTLALAIGLWFCLHRWHKIRDAKTKLAAAVDTGNPDEMLRACDEVEASGADATGVPAVRRMASVLRRLATLCEPGEIVKACDDAEAAGVNEHHVQAFRQKACKIRGALRRLAAAEDSGDAVEMHEACDEAEASGAAAARVHAVRLKANIIRAEDEVNFQLMAMRFSLKDLQANFAAEDSLHLLTLLAATLTALQSKLIVACKCVSCHEAVLAGQAPVCSQGTHSLCPSCFEKYARAEQDQPETVIRQRGALLECPCRAPADACCKGSFSEQTMAKYLPSELFDTHMGLQRQQIRAEEHAKANQMLNKLAAEWERQVPGLSQELLANQLKAALPGAHQCGRCGFGPVLHDRCDNLSTHHNESSGRTRISNACPSCGHFSGNISGWPRWDGRVRHLAQARSAEVQAYTDTKAAASSSDSRSRAEQIRRDYELAVRLSRAA
ncbi:unnamed protein product [Symbiodinium sp. CCMP2592]|nr:unnamed protein product [Symbiodinium sp. CCMP2592]